MRGRYAPFRGRHSISYMPLTWNVKISLSPTSGPAHQNFSLPLRKRIEINWQKPQEIPPSRSRYRTIPQLLAPHMKADEPEVIDLFARLNFYQEQHQNAECEYGTLSCNTPGCTVHGTPLPHPRLASRFSGSPPATNPNKRKENDDDGFVSPSRRQTIKKPNLILSPNFNIETGNKFNNLKNRK
ncbi:hypothetical protein TNCV_994211 [Trichonephila clavipes]|nr:hypothetical protein TNCV_994211 [Trichonephila clavipes]